MTGLLTVGFMFIWFFVTQKQATLNSIAPKFQRERLIQGMEASKMASTTAADSSRSQSSYVEWLERYRLNPVLLHDIEWLMIALAIGPLTGHVFEGVLVGGAGMLGYRALQTTSFWWRRRSEISTV